jgi:hypothetical protein
MLSFAQARILAVATLGSLVCTAAAAAGKDASKGTGPASAAKAPAPASTDEKGPPQAQPKSFSAVVKPDKVKLGETFTYTLEIRHGKDERYELPRDLSFGDEFNIVKIDTARDKEGDGAVTRFEIKAALFDLGEKRIPDLRLAVAGPSGEQVLVVPGPPVNGGGDLKEGEEGKLFDILPPVAVNVPRYTALYVLAATLAAVGLGLMLYRYLKRRPKREARAIPVTRKPLHERALEALLALQSEDLPGKGRGREFHYRLSEILRDYLGERFSFHAVEMTTEELLSTLSRMPTPGLDYRALEALCRESDLIKFAKVAATPGECKAAVEAAMGFIRATTLMVGAASPSSVAQGAISP